MTAAAYIRVSSRKGQKTDAQRAELEAWAKRQHFKNVQWFEDRETGKHLDRLAFQKMQAAIFGGSIDTVMVWKLDRLARNLKDGINVVADWCQRGIRVVSITQQIDLNGPVGQLIAGVGVSGGLDPAPVTWSKLPSRGAADNYAANDRLYRTSSGPAICTEPQGGALAKISFLPNAR